MNNTKQIIDNHNKCLLNSTGNTSVPADNTKNNSQQKNACPLNGNCLQSSVVYQATVTRNDNNTAETYIGLTENDFKTRYRNHTASFRHTRLRNCTELSKHIWTLKVSNMAHYFIKLTLQQRKQEMQPMPQGKIPNYLPTRIVNA